MSRSCECGERTFGNSDDSERFDSGAIHSAARCVGMVDEIAALRAENEALKGEVERLQARLLGFTFPGVQSGAWCPVERAETAEAEVGRLKREGEEAARLWKSALSGQVAAEAALESLRGEVREVVGEVEWSSVRHGRKWCPCCWGTPGTSQADGHAPDCRIAALLKRVGP